MSSVVTVCHVFCCHCVTHPISVTVPCLLSTYSVMSSVTVYCVFFYHVSHPLSLYLTFSFTVCHVLYCVTFTVCHCVSRPLSHPLSLCVMSCPPETCWEQPRQAAARPSPSSFQQSSCSTSYPSCRAMVGGALNAGGALNGGRGFECWVRLM